MATDKTFTLPEITAGKKILVFGDTHFDDTFNGEHVDYRKNTEEVMQKILDVYNKEKPDWVILAGDLIGVSRGKSKTSTRPYLSEVIKFLTVLGGGKRHLIVVKGNHDFNIESDYNFLASIKVFYTPDDFNGMIRFTGDNNQESELFFHLRNYGQEDKDIYPDNATTEVETHLAQGTNIVIAHNDFYVAGKEEGYHDPDKAIDLTTFSPFYGADLVLSGHIHVPSTRPTLYNVPNSTDPRSFLNLGSPSRPSSSEVYNKVWYAKLSWSEGPLWDFTPVPMVLKDYREEFLNSEDLIQSVTKLANSSDKEHQEKLKSILSLLSEDNLLVDDPIEQVDLIRVASKTSKDLAKQYIQRAREKV